MISRMHSLEINPLQLNYDTKHKWCSDDSRQNRPAEHAPQFGICLVDEASSAPPATAEPAPRGATGRRAEPVGEPPSVKSSSVVAKVAKLLIHRGEDLPAEHPGHWEESYVHQKVMLSLQPKQTI